MAELVFNAEGVKPREEMGALPPGDYKVAIMNTGYEPTSAGTGHFLKIEMDVVDGPMKGRKLFDRLNLDNPNPQAVEIAQATLSAICHSTGKVNITDSTQLHNIPIIAVVKSVPKKKQGVVVPGEFSNEISTYKKVGAGPTTGRSGGGATGAGTTTTGDQSGAAPSTGGMPWQRKG